MKIEELKSKYCGLYYTNLYELDFEKTYVKTSQIYRVDGVESLGDGTAGVRFICTVISICTDINKKTGEKNVRIAAYEDGIISMGDLENHHSYRFKESNEDEWNLFVDRLTGILRKKRSLNSLEEYCEVCLSKETESCKVCCRRGTDVPSQYMEKK
jgi:hypothetical protein